MTGVPALALCAFVLARDIIAHFKTVAGWAEECACTAADTTHTDGFPNV